MDKINVLTESIVRKLVYGYPESFVNLDVIPDPVLIALKEKYLSILERNRMELHLMGKVEDLITKKRVRESLKTDVRLSHVRGYIYGRTPLFRDGENNRDIRVVVGRVSQCGSDLTALLANSKFMKQARVKVLEALDKEIQSDILEIEEFEENFQRNVPY